MGGQKRDETDKPQILFGGMNTIRRKEIERGINTHIPDGESSIQWIFLEGVLCAWHC